MRYNTLLSKNILIIFLILFAGINVNISQVQAEESNRHNFNIWISAPADGDKWEIGTEQTLVWSDDNHHGADTFWVVVWLSTEARGDSTPVDTFPFSEYVPGEGGEVVWTVTGTESNMCRLFLEQLSNDPDVFGLGGMEAGEYFTLLPGTAIQPVIDHVPSFTILHQPASALNIKVYDLIGRMVWETDNGSTFTDMQKRLKNGTYLVMYDYSSQRFTQKINLMQ